MYWTSPTRSVPPLCYFYDILHSAREFRFPSLSVLNLYLVNDISGIVFVTQHRRWLYCLTRSSGTCLWQMGYSVKWMSWYRLWFRHRITCVCVYIYIYNIYIYIIYRGKAMANYPQELVQDAVCQSHTGHMTGLWFLPAQPLRLNTNEWMDHSIITFTNMTPREPTVSSAQTTG